MLAVLLSACAPPFDHTRKDLDDFRLLGVRWGETPEAAVWSGEGAFHRQAPTLEWSIDAAAGTAGVRVEDTAGHVEEGLLVRGTGGSPVVTGFRREVAGDIVTLELEVEGDVFTRWAASSGVFYETGPNAAEWTAEDEPLTTVFALTLDGAGGVTWTWIDIALDEGPYLAVGGRLLPVDVAPSGPGEWLAELASGDTLAGVTLTDLQPADDTSPSVCGLEPFDIDALVDGRCGLDEAIGARVRVAGAPWP